MISEKNYRQLAEIVIKNLFRKTTAQAKAVLQFCDRLTKRAWHNTKFICNTRSLSYGGLCREMKLAHTDFWEVADAIVRRYSQFRKKTPLKA